jgi:hypothetical protein
MTVAIANTLDAEGAEADSTLKLRRNERPQRPADRRRKVLSK